MQLESRCDDSEAQERTTSSSYQLPATTTALSPLVQTNVANHVVYSSVALHPHFPSVYCSSLSFASQALSNHRPTVAHQSKSHSIIGQRPNPAPREDRGLTRVSPQDSNIRIMASLDATYLALCPAFAVAGPASTIEHSTSRRRNQHLWWFDPHAETHLSCPRDALA